MQEQYDPKVTPWQISEKDFPSSGNLADKLRFLLHYAILAPSSHNTQPWKFMVNENTVRIFIDQNRWLKIADADQRELHISIGCTLENFLIAAEHFGFEYEVTYFPKRENAALAVSVALLPNGQPEASGKREIFYAITKRTTNRNVYEELTIPKGDLRLLENCYHEDKEGIFLHLTSDPEIKQKVDELMARADTLQFSDPEYREELGYWIGQGLLGTPWLISKLGRLAVTHLDLGNSQAKRDSKALESAPVLGVISSETDDRVSQIKVGQVFERIGLTANTIGVQIQPMSQIIQIPELRDEVAQLIPKPGVIPQHTFRLGYGKVEKGHTPRRELEEFMIYPD